MTASSTTAQAFLQEAVYRSRARQAAGTALAALAETEQAPEARDAGNCGLGVKAAVELDLSDRGAELFAELWPDGLAAGALPRVREVMRAWIQRQDALDRKRNHFLRDFRGSHGADRSAYAPETLTAYEQGLDAVNAEVTAGLEAAAQALLDAGQPAE